MTTTTFTLDPVQQQSRTVVCSSSRGGSWSDWRSTNTLIWEECVLIPFTPAAANYCSKVFFFFSLQDKLASTVESWTFPPVCQYQGPPIAFESSGWQRRCQLEFLLHSWAPLRLVVATDKIGNLNETHKPIWGNGGSRRQLAGWCFVNFGLRRTADGRDGREQRVLMWIYKSNTGMFPSSFLPEMASSIFLRAPKVVMPSSFRSWSVRVRKVWRSIWN